METREVLGIILAVIVVIIVIGVLSMVKGSRSKDTDPATDQIPAVSEAVVTGTSSIWDQIHQAQTTTAAEETAVTAEGTVLTGEDGSVLTDESGNASETTETTAVTEPADTVPADPFNPQPEPTETEGDLPAITQAPDTGFGGPAETMIVIRP